VKEAADLGRALPLPVTIAAPALRARAADFLALTKPRLNLLVVATAMVGFYLGLREPVRLVFVIHTLVGTALVAAGAAALNQFSERDTDGLMRRTRARPLPAGRLRPIDARNAGLALSAIGLLELALGANPLAASVAFVTLVSYSVVYTPLKRRTSLATIAGAVPGALPPMIGWAAARGTLSIEAWTLFAIVFFWQMPHFLAIAWMYREDFGRAGFPLLPVIEPDGRSTGRQAVAIAAALVPVSVVPGVVGVAGLVYTMAALALGSGLLALAVVFARTRTAEAARRLFLGSLAYLPLLWGMMIADRL
jgi:protoheme IX farnesyltransferase